MMSTSDNHKIIRRSWELFWIGKQYSAHGAGEQYQADKSTAYASPSVAETHC